MRDRLLMAALAAAAFAFGAWGAGWDLPSERRAAGVLDPRWDRAALFDRLAGGWENIYRQAEGSTPLAAEAAGKYSTRLKGSFSSDFKGALPEPELWNSYRSLLIRSRYPDEAQPLSNLARMRPAQLDFRPPSFLYGGGYLYPLGAYYLALSRLGAVETLPLRQALERPGTLGGVYLAGRLLSAAAFAGVCLLVFLITRRLEPAAALPAYAAALLLPALGVHARYLTPHLWSAFWALAGLYLTLRALPGLGLKPLLAAGACAGLAAGSYWSAAHAAAFLLAAYLSAGAAALRPGALKRLGLAALAGAAVFLLVNPYLPFSLAEAAAEFSPGVGQAGGGRATGPAALFLHVLPAALGPVFAVLVPAGCAWGLFSGRALVRNLSLAWLVLALPAALTLYPEFPAGVRRFFPWLLVGALLAVCAACSLGSRLKPAARTALLAALLLPGAVMSAAYALCFSDASGAASSFGRMAARLDAAPAGKTLGLTEFPQPAYVPFFRLDRWRLRLADAAAMSALPRARLPEYLFVNFDQRQALAPALDAHYALEAAYGPRRLLWFTPDPLLCAANPPVELYRLKEAP